TGRVYCLGTDRSARLSSRAVRTRAVSAVPHRGIVDSRDILGAQASRDAAKNAAESVCQEIQRAVCQQPRQALRPFLLLGQQTARVLSDVASRPERVRPDDARERARTWGDCA